MSEFSVAIMAGGKSSRMGTDKAFVELMGKPMIEHLLARVSDLGQAETLLITNHPKDYNHLKLPIYSDIIPDKGPLGGIYTAIHHSSNDYTLVIACDMPFISPELMRYMVGLRSGAFDVIVPRVQERPQGLIAVYSKTCLAPIREHLDAGRLRVFGFYGDVSVRYVDEAEYQSLDSKGLSFYNVNTPADLEKARQLAGDSMRRTD